jgi:hypothetical protein
MGTHLCSSTLRRRMNTLGENGWKPRSRDLSRDFLPNRSSTIPILGSVRGTTIVQFYEFLFYKGLCSWLTLSTYVSSSGATFSLWNQRCLSAVRHRDASVCGVSRVAQVLEVSSLLCVEDSAVLPRPEERCVHALAGNISISDSSFTIKYLKFGSCRTN